MAGLVLADLRANPALTARTSKAAMLVRGVVLPPLYLFTRQRRLGRGQAPFSIHLGLSVVALTASFVAGGRRPPRSSSTTRPSRRRSQARCWPRPRPAWRSAARRCQSATAGHSFTCTLLDEDGATDVLVHMVDDQTFRWEVMGR